MKINLLFTFLITALSSFGQDYKIVETGTLNVRNGAGEEWDAIGEVHQADTLQILHESDGWSKIKTETGLEGFVSNQYLSEKTVQEPKEKEEQKSRSWTNILINIGVIAVILYFVGGFLKSMFGKQTKTKSNGRTKLNTVATKKTSKYICKFCGAKYGELNKLTKDTCHKSPTQKHQPLEGGEQSQYICECCGSIYNDLSTLTKDTCHNSPTHKHRPFIGGILESYSCKFCGSKYKELKTLTKDTCHKSPTSKHQPFY